MTFGYPHALWLLALVAAAALFDGLRREQKRSLFPRLTRVRAHATRLELGGAGGKREFRWRIWLACALVVVALAGPRVGFVRENEEQNPREIVIAVDLSRSMLARDVKPSRLDHAKLLAASLISRAAGDRFALVPFSSSAYVQLPLGDDYEVLGNMLPSLSPDFFPYSGTNFAELLRVATALFSTTGNSERYLVVLSDGEAWDKDWKTGLAELKARNIHVISLGVGTPGGSLVPDGNRALRDSNGAEVVSRLVPATLEELAKATGGAYQRADAYVDIVALLKSSAERHAVATGTKVDPTRLAERYRWALLPALLLLAFSLWKDFAVHPSNRTVKLPASTTPIEGAMRATAVSALAIGLFTFFTAPSIQSQDLAMQPDGEFNEVAAGSPMQSNAKLVTQRINVMLASPKLNENDCVSLVIDIVAYCEQMLRARLRFPISIIDDARRAIDAGEKIDPQGGGWAQLRQRLDELYQDVTEPWKTASADAAGKTAMEIGYDPNSEAPERRRRGGSSTGGEELGNLNDIALPLLKLEQVRRQDQPARLFLAIEGKNRQNQPPLLPQW